LSDSVKGKAPFPSLSLPLLQLEAFPPNTCGTEGGTRPARV